MKNENQKEYDNSDRIVNTLLELVLGNDIKTYDNSLLIKIKDFDHRYNIKPALDFSYFFFK